MTKNCCDYLSHEHLLRLAHRGSRLLWPENTITAFQGAVDYGCQYIETDLHVTKDGVIVIFHDDRLERLTNGTGQVSQWLWQDLRKLDAAYHFKPEEDYPLRGKGITISSLEEVLETFPNTMFNLDLKQPGIEPRVAEFINKNHCHDRVLIASFYGSRTRKCSKLLDKPTATSAGKWEVFRLLMAARIKKRLNTTADVLQVPVRKNGITVVNETLIAAAHEEGVQVHVWTINEAEEMNRLLQMGVDGIVTDRIDILNEVLEISP